MKSFMKRLSNWIHGFKGTLIYCPKCKSLKVTFGEITESYTIHGKVETYPVTCLDCGAKGTISETWEY